MKSVKSLQSLYTGDTLSGEQRQVPPLFYFLFQHKEFFQPLFGCLIGLRVPSRFAVASVQSVPDKDCCILTGEERSKGGQMRTKDKGNVFLQNNSL